MSDLRSITSAEYIAQQTGLKDGFTVKITETDALITETNAIP